MGGPMMGMRGPPPMGPGRDYGPPREYGGPRDFGGPRNYGPPPPRDLGPPPPAQPEFVVDREKTCPLLLRVFTKPGSHHKLEEFAVSRGPACWLASWAPWSAAR